MINGSSDAVSDNDLRAQEWEAAPNTPDRCNILQWFPSSRREEEKELLITLCNKRLINASSECSAITTSQR